MKRILLVSDQKYIHPYLKKEFKEDGYQVLTTSIRKETISQLTSIFIKSDLMILDLRAHDKNESETLGHVIKHKYKLPVIVFPAQSIFMKREASRTEVDADETNS
jgi:DNA-binding NtrC family response regulator